jgi:APA family basic amino acid/polyamine antiporter
VSGSFDQLITFATSPIVAFSTLTVAAVVILRWRRPDLERGFRMPGGVLLPLLFVGVNVWVLWCVLASGAREARIGVAIVATGVPAYAAFRARRRSQETVR